MAVFHKPKPNIIKASYRLMQKVGTGAVSVDMVAECDKFIAENHVDFLPWALSCMKDLNEALQASIEAGHALDDVLRQDLIAPIMQLKASGAMFRNAPLTEIAGSLLHFLEALPHLDNDVVEIVKANEKVLTAFLKDGESENMTPVKQQLIDALRGACNRYAAKNKLPPFFKSVA